ncbi:MAG: hypothetical protein R2867_29190 [Caldilineaceae bacterium]
MSDQLALATLLPRLANHAQNQRVWQITDPTHPDYGAIYQAEWGVADPRTTGKFITLCGYLALGEALPDDQLLEQASLAATYLLRARRPSGLIDLISVNIDSGPDTGFAVQELCTVLELAKTRTVTHPRWPQLLEQIGVFVREAVPAIANGGFHTPNHRWVIVSALLQAHALFPDLVVRAAVESYLAETIDIDAEGMFIERSIGVYDAVNDRSLLFIYENLNLAAALAAVHRNLEADLHLLHADGTAETGISRRQDYGTRYVALGLAPYLLWSHRLAANPTFARAATAIWRQFLQNDQPTMNDRSAHLDWLTYVLLKYGDADEVDAALPDNYVRYLPHNGIHRVRRGKLSATFFRDVTRFLTLTFGQAELSSVKLSQTYFGQYIGRFRGDEMDFAAGELRLRSKGEANPRRPAYEMPLGRPVPPEQWNETMSERALRWLPHAVTTLTVCEAAGGFDLYFQTEQGADQVATQIAFDFPAGGIWETADTRMLATAGQTIFLKQGWGAMRYGPDVIHIGPGHLAHGMWQMREAEPASDHVRVLLTFFTPLDFTVQIRTTEGPLLPAVG